MRQKRKNVNQSDRICRGETLSAVCKKLSRATAGHKAHLHLALVLCPEVEQVSLKPADGAVGTHKTVKAVAEQVKEILRRRTGAEDKGNEGKGKCRADGT